MLASVDSHLRVPPAALCSFPRVPGRPARFCCSSSLVRSRGGLAGFPPVFRVLPPPWFRRALRSCCPLPALLLCLLPCAALAGGVRRGVARSASFAAVLPLPSVRPALAASVCGLLLPPWPCCSAAPRPSLSVLSSLPLALRAFAASCRVAWRLFRSAPLVLAGARFAPPLGCRGRGRPRAALSAFRARGQHGVTTMVSHSTAVFGALRSAPAVVLARSGSGAGCGGLGLASLAGRALAVRCAVRAVPCARARLCAACALGAGGRPCCAAFAAPLAAPDLRLLQADQRFAASSRLGSVRVLSRGPPLRVSWCFSRVCCFLAVRIPLRSSQRRAPKSRSTSARNT